MTHDFDEKIDKFYEDSPWAELAKQAGLRPSQVERQTRTAFQFCAEKLAEIAKLCEEDSLARPYLLEALRARAGVHEAFEIEKLNKILTIIRGNRS